MKRILVTGAAGQIGSELTMELRRKYRKSNVIATDIRTPNERIETNHLERLDVTERGDVEKIVEQYDIDTIYHLAAILSATGERDPNLAWHVNMKGLCNILEVARLHELVRLFWPSSVAVFGTGAPRVETPQDAILIPSTMYGVTKAAGELMCNHYFERFALDVRSIRYPGIISHQNPPRGGTTDYAVQMFYEAIRSKRYTCFVREDTRLPMMYMPDCIKATNGLMEASMSMIKSHMGYNVAGMSFSAGELASEIRKHIPDFKCEYRPDFRQRIADSWPMSLDDSLARKDWGWEPQFYLASMTKEMIKKLKGKLENQ